MPRPRTTEDGPYTNSLRRCREAANLTQAALGALTGIHHTQLSKFEAGKQELCANNLRKLRQVLPCTSDELITAFLEPVEPEPVLSYSGMVRQRLPQYVDQRGEFGSYRPPSGE